ncbi:uncharacterized protein LOC124275289 isoform X3 [Haliotis rubra]|uniref:uncharacterized protein LOC124275289 isoform X2 n=1 Tax=Haliotis rubra TaxID=36100 RepID=UPI001EE5B6B6|nr:uncharacterized protein LOC124275289 isoform X2 [Haliotis rubra]XP_046566729.1 uncharacterized protein LOC124275289 isoform X3 [Haliotis rubra]
MTANQSVLFRVMVAVSFGITLFLIGYISSHFKPIKDLEVALDSENTEYHHPHPIRVDNYESRCPSVLQNMTQGHWRTRQLTEAQKNRSYQYFYQKGVPKSLQRPDNRCGNVGYTNVTTFLRAICSPTGPTPCCYNFKCVKKTEAQCRCKNCWDIRQQIHAEYSTWTPSDPRCRPQQYSANQTCHLLDGGTIRFFGDSLVQHIYTAFLMTVRGNFKDGGIRPSDTRVWKKRCPGMNMFRQIMCMGRLDARPNICSGRVKLTWKEHYLSGKWPELINEVTNSLNNRRTLFVVSIGIHENYNSTNVQMQYLKPTLDRLRKIGIPWPKVLFVDMNAPGIMKRSDKQSKPQVLRFNQDMEKFLNEYAVPVLKTFNMTDGVQSFDGTHYDLEVNVVKANILLNYIQELSDAGVW